MVCSLDGIGSNFMALAYILVDSDDLMVAALISVGLVCVRLLYSVVLFECWHFEDFNLLANVFLAMLVLILTRQNLDNTNHYTISHYYTLITFYCIRSKTDISDLVFPSRRRIMHDP